MVIFIGHSTLIFIWQYEGVKTGDLYMLQSVFEMHLISLWFGSVTQKMGSSEGRY